MKTYPNRDPAALEPRFREALLNALEQANRETRGKFKDFARWELFEGWRSVARQRELYTRGRTRRGPVVTWTLQSNHLLGIAADIVWIDHQGRRRWDGPPELWQRLGHAARSHGLVWGGDWKRPDPPHIESRTDRPLP